MYKEIFGIISAGLGVALFVTYFIEIFRDSVRPHVFSWVTWSLLTGVAFLVSRSSGGGSGTWILAIETVMCGVIAVYALFKGEKNITKLDWASFIAALLVFGFYLTTHNAIWSAILAASIDTLGFIPTFRKSYEKPFEEPISSYLLSGLGYLFSIPALGRIVIVPVIYPATLVVTNLVFVLFLMIRRKVANTS